MLRKAAHLTCEKKRLPRTGELVPLLPGQGVQAALVESVPNVSLPNCDNCTLTQVSRRVVQSQPLWLPLMRAERESFVPN